MRIKHTLGIYLLSILPGLVCLLSGAAIPVWAGSLQPDGVTLQAENRIAGPEAKNIQVVLAFYNAENLYDTVPNPLTNDGDYTPQGLRRWNTQRYAEKIGHIARVIDELNADLIGLSEIENETVVRDLMYAMKQDYNYVHRNTNDLRGMDLVLLYRGSRFIPQRVRLAGRGTVRREFLVVDGELLGEPVSVVVCHMPSMMNSSSRRNAAADALHALGDSLISIVPERKVIVMGDFNTTPGSAVGRRVAGDIFFTPFTESERQGYGSYVYRDRRFQYDFVLLSRNMKHTPGLHFSGKYGIFARDYLLYREGPKTGYPLRSFDGGNYTGGYSDHLPVWLVLEKQE